MIKYSSISSISKRKKSAVEELKKMKSVSKMDAYKYERIFVKIITEIAAQKGINDAQLARKAWPHQKGAPTAWRKMRNDDEAPKRLNIEEAVLLTQALGISMSDVCGMVQGRLMRIDTAPQDISPDETKGYAPHEGQSNINNYRAYKN